MIDFVKFKIVLFIYIWMLNDKCKSNIMLFKLIFVYKFLDFCCWILVLFVLRLWDISFFIDFLDKLFDFNFIGLVLGILIKCLVFFFLLWFDVGFLVGIKYVKELIFLYGFIFFFIFVLVLIFKDLFFSECCLEGVYFFGMILFFDFILMFFIFFLDFVLF